MNGSTLRKMFDFQRYAQNSDLQQMILQTEMKYGLSGTRGELDDEDLELVAGGVGAGFAEDLKSEQEKINK